MKLLKIKPAGILSYFSALTSRGLSGDWNRSVLTAADWLLRAQKVNGDGGYAHSFHFLYGWERSYPETTGYIIPTVHECFLRFKEEKYLESTKQALKYLDQVQEEDGSFVDLDRNKQVFDTGQILIGLNYALENEIVGVTKMQVQKAAEWLVQQQNESGAFVQHVYNSVPHAYYSRVGAALIRSGKILGRQDIIDAGCRNVQWTCAQQLPSGFYHNSSFEGGDLPAYSHTIIYVLEGLMDAYSLLKTEQLYSCIEKSMQTLANVVNRDGGLLKSKYDREMNCVNDSICVTGLAQWAGVCLRWRDETKSSVDFVTHAKQALLYLKSQQFTSGRDLKGGLPGSVPHAAPYMKYSIPNWGLKFYIDSSLLGIQMGVI